MLKNKFKSSFTLIEILVFVTILTLFFISAVTVTTYFLQTIKYQQYKILATHYVEEAVEWLKSEKEKDWEQFSSYDSSGNGTTYCFNDLNFNSLGPCENFSLANSLFKRELIIKNIGSPVNQVETVVTVYWQERNTENKVFVKSVFNLIE